MPTSKQEPGVVRVNGNRGGLLVNDVQRSEEIPRGTNAFPRETDEEASWRHAFRVLSAVLSRQFVSGDLLVLVAYELRDHLSDEAVQEYVEHAGLNRSKIVNNFMG